MAEKYNKDQLIAMVRGVAARYGIDAAIGIKQLAQESANFTPAVVYGPRKSSAGAMGIAQFMPATAKRFGLSNAFDPVQALEAWGKYMSLLLKQFNGRYDLALAGYNWGENRATLRNALASGKAITTYSIPAETKKYVTIILGGSMPVTAPGSLPPVGGSDSSQDAGAGLGLPTVPGDSGASWVPILALAALAGVGAWLID